MNPSLTGWLIIIHSDSVGSVRVSSFNFKPAFIRLRKDWSRAEWVDESIVLGSDLIILQ